MKTATHTIRRQLSDIVPDEEHIVWEKISQFAEEVAQEYCEQEGIKSKSITTNYDFKVDISITFPIKKGRKDVK